ncbi:MAG: hypothetical protein J6X83_04560, partial [Methanomicrobium sp.]|nr:hypothetical protein [Methanomicrobium sp.]
VEFKMIKVPSEINHRIAPWVMRYITDNNKKIDVRGPMFTAVRWEIEPTECTCGGEECDDPECECHCHDASHCCDE